MLSVREGAPLGSYQLQVRVSEPVWPDVTCTAQVDVLELQPKALQSPASLRLSSESAGGVAASATRCSPLPLLPWSVKLLLFFADLTVEQFFASSGSHQSPFSRLTGFLAEVLEEPSEHVHVFSVGGASRLGAESVDVWVAADGSRQEKLLGYMEASRAKVSEGGSKVRAEGHFSQQIEPLLLLRR